MLVKKVIAASFAGLLFKSGDMLILAAPLVTVGVVDTVYTKLTPAIVKVSPACGIDVKPSTFNVPPDCPAPFTKGVPYCVTLILVQLLPVDLYK